jgi:hypothetical protein
MAETKSQSDKFKEAARELEADEDEARWKERLKKIAKTKPSSDPGASDPPR